MLNTLFTFWPTEYNILKIDKFSISMVVLYYSMVLTKVLSFVGGAPNSEVRQARPE